MGYVFWLSLNHLSSNRAESFYGNSGDYYVLWLLETIFLMLFRKKYNFLREMGVAAMVAPKGRGLKTRPKRWPYEWTFWVNRYLGFSSGTVIMLVRAETRKMYLELTELHCEHKSALSRNRNYK